MILIQEEAEAQKYIFQIKKIGMVFLLMVLKDVEILKFIPSDKDHSDQKNLTKRIFNCLFLLA